MDEDEAPIYNIEHFLDYQVPDPLDNPDINALLHAVHLPLPSSQFVDVGNVHVSTASPAERPILRGSSGSLFTMITLAMRALQDHCAAAQRDQPGLQFFAIEITSEVVRTNPGSAAYTVNCRDSQGRFHGIRLLVNEPWRNTSLLQVAARVWLRPQQQVPASSDGEGSDGPGWV